MSDFAPSSLRMSFGDFLAFLDTRPDEEKWELVEGVPTLSPSPVYAHQIVVRNLIISLTEALPEPRSGLVAIPGIGVHVNEFNAPVPDVMIRPLDNLQGSFCDDMLVAFEVLSPGTASRDRRWKRDVYAALPAVHHYVLVSPDPFDVVHFARAAAFSPLRLKAPGDVVELDALGISVPLSRIYLGLT